MKIFYLCSKEELYELNLQRIHNSGLLRSIQKSFSKHLS
ncbi:hypothetical protein TPE_0645 [Treponema pedis str. T A4]|uniref:Uncharacterized protein n=1 Tax=Treponema pedis str. T A4 TaxID=1291379 RepID=S5ZKR4_9SPIR|nr:hypothetical protein TPE_0645 [Treponema pedis str. T A4]